MYAKTFIGLVGLVAVAHAGGPDTTCTDDPTAPAYSVPSSSSEPVGAYVPSSSSSAPAPSGTPDCWSTCFQQAGITSEADLCGNTEVDQCIQDGCSAAEDKAYWSWYDSYCSVSSSSAVPSSTEPPTGPYTPSSSSTIPSISASATPDCWSQCFQQAGVTSEEDLCGNTEVDQCIQDNCSAAEDKAYWAWYDSFCPAPSASSSIPVVPASSSTPVSPVTPSSTPDCWSECFQEAGITSESELCGNTQVDQCIQDKCSAASDEAYWAWYESFCPAVTTLITITSTVPCTTGPSSPETTTYVTTTTYPGVPAGSPPASPASPAGPGSSPASPVGSGAPGAPPAYSSPASPVGSGAPGAPGAPYPSGSPAGAAGTAAASTGWGAQPSASGYGVVPSTGDAAVNKPAAFVIGAVALAALF